MVYTMKKIFYFFHEREFSMRKAVLLVVLLLLAGCATSPTGRKQLMIVSPEQAISASKDA